uniref:Carbohydrate kinase PfkB domain-containing protein n=1 Tax=Percolomonas cosmopolitus TaxID=63605 RepID=A0A7S1KS19_9EUKA|mmetsp:Transcript_7160/g.26825  ORF Transcript_7160/g.26825 Transcript_7160/m.26825 type:complete len:402 (+) Transcript_7160:99-1304(+)|eukprot:CAMPEP_0117447920 /NCGR_PEP_ID=MMETSP0759-20121206/7125_1 /TAXON_ID=63605 /ORGANISM="Percolomonas cosmopolitus, Strain WS" /LENGTH=401 /DNA_ID=CAMNT_0005240273 /DNA_START=69 /DNA_END=1274 /DNA_ORIENTATION=-
MTVLSLGSPFAMRLHHQNHNHNKRSAIGHMVRNSRMPCVLALGQPIVDSLIRVTDEELMQLGITETDGSILMNSESEFLELWGKVRALGKDIIMCPGGSASNTIKTVAAFGTPAGLTGKIGDDEIGRVFSSALRSRGVKDLTTKSFQSKTGQVLCFVTKNGQTMRSYLGASMEMNPTDLLEEDFDRSQCSLLHVEGYAVYNEQLLTAALKLAAKHKLEVSFDISPPQIAHTKGPVLKKMLRDYVSIAFCNSMEAEALFPQAKGDPREACRKLGKLVRIAVVTCDKDGCYVKDPEGEIFHVSPIRVDNVLDTTGAGDCFAGAFLHALNAGYNLKAAARLGTLAGAHIVQVMGAELPKDRIQHILQEFNSPNAVLRDSDMKESKKIAIPRSPSSSSGPIRIRG